jgi:ribonucleotide reductase alpha subunit
MISNNIDIDIDTLKTMEVDYVIKRDGNREEMEFDKILKRIKLLSDGLKVNPSRVTQKVCSMIYPNVNTSELDELAGQVSSSLATEHPDYGILASRIIISNHHKNTSPSFSETIAKLYSAGLINDDLKHMVDTHANKLNDIIDYQRDYLIDYFGFKTLEKSYLMRVNKVILERPQHLFLRVALAINIGDLRAAIDTYDLCSQKYYTHATPTLFNAGTHRQQLSSCFLLAMKDDSIDGIFATLKDCAMISKWAGGIGLHIHNVRAKNSHIQGTNGISNGIVPMLRVFNNTARYVDQCVLPDTIIYTTSGPMKMEDVVVGETRIYNAMGETEIVENVLEHPYEGKMVSIETQHSIDKLTITPEHPVYALQGQQKGLNYNVIKNRLEKKLVAPDWVDAGELSTDDMIGYPIPTYEKDISSISVQDCYMYGVILGDGCLNNANTNGYIAVNKDTKRHILDFAQDYFNKKLVPFRLETKDNTARLYWSKNVNLPFKYSDIYKNKEKYCAGRWLNLPLNKSRMILKGLIDTDGCLHNEVGFDSTSYNLIETVRFICLRMGVLTSGYTLDRVGESHITKYGDEITNKKISYCLRIPKTVEICDLLDLGEEENGKFFKFLKHDNMLFTRVQTIVEREYNGTLYDLQMAHEHNYLLHNGLVHNGGGKRNGSIAIYIEPWHRDIMDFLLLRKNHGNEEDRARDLFYAIWMPDLFMKRVEDDADWSLFCPHECPGLSDLIGDAFEEKYIEYEASGKGTKVTAREIWYAILESQIETGNPYICYKDASNLKSNQQNLGVIKSSNLCTEIVEYSSSTESAVCNLASIGLSNFVRESIEGNDTTMIFDYQKLYEVVKVVTKNLDKVIDINYYPIPEAKRSNTLHRPIGIGVQGLADVFAMLDIPFGSEEAAKINQTIFETIYFGAMEKSMELAKMRGELLTKLKEVESFVSNPDLDLATNKINSTENEINALKTTLNPMDVELDRDTCLGSYSSFEGSPLSKGYFQFDLWDAKEFADTTGFMWDWNSLRDSVKQYGVRNSLLVAPMPTASTSQILGNNECIEPFTSNIYLRRTLAGEFVVVNKYLIRKLVKLNIWNETIKNAIIKNNGSIQSITEIPDSIKEVFKTVWEIGNKHLIDMAASRGRFICQSQSLNLFMDKPDFRKLSSMHFYSWRKGLKTGIYYLRTKPVAQAQQFTIEPDAKPANGEPLLLACSRDNPDCEACGS